MRDSAPPRASPRPIVVLGDLNCTPDSALYRFLLNGKLTEPLSTEGMWDGQRPNPNGNHRSLRGGASTRPQHSARRAPGSQHPYHRSTPTSSAPTHTPSSIPLPDSSTTAPIAPPPAPAETARSRSPAFEATHALSCAPLVSAYAQHGEPQCTSYHGGFQGTVDYILLEPNHFHIRQLLPTPSLADMMRRGSLPDQWTPSDHVPIAADLEWKGSYSRAPHGFQASCSGGAAGPSPLGQR